jgi:hypothetical protein
MVDAAESVTVETDAVSPVRGDDPGAPLEVRLAHGELDVTVERVSSTEAADRAQRS